MLVVFFCACVLIKIAVICLYSLMISSTYLSIQRETIQGYRRIDFEGVLDFA